MKKFIINLFLGLALLSVSSCGDYLDMVPDNIPTIEQVFNTRDGAWKMLHTCYDYIPRPASLTKNPAFLCGDEACIAHYHDPKFYYYRNKSTKFIAEGRQDKINPLLNYWDGGDYKYLDEKWGDVIDDGYIKSLWAGIRNCNIFLDYIDTVPDMKVEEKNRWKAEVQVLKAYFHYYLLQLYGPIPYMDEALDVSLSPEEVQRERETVDAVVEKIVACLDEAINSNYLPAIVVARQQELGRINLPVAKTIKAKVLVLAASPLFNGNKQFAALKNKDGVSLINPEYDQTKWEKAATACKEAIECCEAAAMGFYTFDQEANGLEVSDKTQLELSLRGQMTQKTENPELIWGIGRQDVARFIYTASCPLNESQIASRPLGFNNLYSATMNATDQFYSRNGLPIEEDKEYEYAKRFSLVSVPEADKFYFNDDPTIRVPYYNTNREPRFYAYLGFDQGRYFCKTQPNDEKSAVIHSKARDFAGYKNTMYCVTGYTVKKVIPWDREYINGVIDNIGNVEYFWPILRMSDLYLMAAEAFNESKEQPDEEVYRYIQPIRTKAGLDTETGSLVDTWSKYSTQPGKPTTKEGMRDIIRQERMVELAFEGQRYWDIRRWMLATEYFNTPLRGWYAKGAEEGDYYKETYIFDRKFSRKDYFWPIMQRSLDSNHKLIQNLGW